MVTRSFNGALHTFERSREALIGGVLDSANQIMFSIQRAGSVLVCGNGGDVSDAGHFAAELIGRFVAFARNGLPVHVLAAEPAFIEAWSSDQGCPEIFAKQVEMFGKPGDVLISVSTSGDSQNVLGALRTAAKMNIQRISLLGNVKRNELQLLSDVALVVPSENTLHVQDIHLLLLHLMWELIQNRISLQSNPLVDSFTPASLFSEANWPSLIR